MKYIIYYAYFLILLFSIAYNRLDMDIEDQILWLMIFYWYIHRFRLNYVQRNKDNTSSLSSEKYTLELLSGSNRQCVELMRMPRDAYVRLCNHFR